ncbi:MAG: hypothetical protein HFG39_10595 [Lachnospiraceae bacterium]|nr:hypothetical protein [Lachnospiraceae bacterium]
MYVTYEELLIEADNNNLLTKEKPLPVSKGRIRGRQILIRSGLIEAEKKCILAEELGHYYTTTGNILDQRDTRNRKQEYRARLWGYNKLVGLHAIVQAYKHGCTNLYDTADFLEITELFLKDLLTCYRSKYGVCKEYGEYIVYFEPYLHVEEKTG